MSVRDKYRSRVAHLREKAGFSVVELMVTLLIFSIILAGAFGAYLAQLKTATRESRYAETDIDLLVARNIMERDIAMAGYGLADDYSATAFTTPRSTEVPSTNPDTLVLRGTALGTKSRAAQGWTYITAVDGSGVPSFMTWSQQTWASNDVRENVQSGDSVILMEPSTKRLLAQGGTWLFRYNGPATNVTPAYTNLSVGTLVYGLESGATQPYYTVQYSLDNTNLPNRCANNGAFRLVRTEISNPASPPPADTVLPCVLDMEVAFGLDTTGKNNPINMWDDSGAAAAGYSPATLQTDLKQVRVYLLVQSGDYDPNYINPNTSIRVGDSTLGVGRDINLTTAQRHCRWKLMTLNVTPRNVR